MVWLPWQRRLPVLLVFLVLLPQPGGAATAAPIEPSSFAVNLAGAPQPDDCAQPDLPSGRWRLEAPESYDPRRPTALVQLVRSMESAEVAAIMPGQPFAVWLRLCLGAADRTVQGLSLSADMPAHRHGMNYAPALVAVAPGLWRADGLVFHMPGRWRLLLDLHTRNADGAASAVRLQQALWVR
ncbi:MAG: hypothetical protein RL722_2570 [Pseudomonadota bacterium]|jgi:hypothetical protein